VVKPGQRETCVELTAQDCDAMHMMQRNITSTKVCAGQVEFPTLCHVVSSANERKLLATAIVRQEIQCPSKISVYGEPAH